MLERDEWSPEGDQGPERLLRKFEELMDTMMKGPGVFVAPPLPPGQLYDSVTHVLRSLQGEAFADPVWEEARQRAGLLRTAVARALAHEASA